MSLAVPSVYSIPMLLFVGWRGEPGKRDEPQHVVQGKATPGLLGKMPTHPYKHARISTFIFISIYTNIANPCHAYLKNIYN